MDFILSKIIEGETKIRGDSDESFIGNVGDALKVSLASTSSTIVVNLSTSSPLDVNLVTSSQPISVNISSSSHTLNKTADSVSVAIDTSSMQNGTTTLTPKFATIEVATSNTSTVSTLISSVTGVRIRVVSYTVVSNATGEFKFQSNASTDLTGFIPVASYGGVVSNFNPVGLFETSAGEGLSLRFNPDTAASGNKISGHLTYIEV